MLSTKCPGQDMRYWTADDVHEENCPKCGEVIEFFKTDIRLRCRNCKTRVANPRFDMGCAEWCAHAEMCLGAGAKGIQKKSFRTVLEEEFARLSGNNPENIEAMKKMIDGAEEKCRREKADMLPVTAASVLIALVKLGLIAETDRYIENLAEKLELPGAVIIDTKRLILIFQGGDGQENYERDSNDKKEKIIAELFSEYGSKFK